MEQNQYPDASSLRAEADKIEASAPGVSDSSEYPRVAKMACAGQVAALRNYAETIEQVGTVPPKRPGMTGEERRERRAAILRLRAARLNVKASQHHRASHDIGCRIPFGQPILVGHHSERGHRRAIERMHNQTSNAFAASKYADSLESRADSVERSHAISSTDSDALEQYQEKLTRLSGGRDHMKAVNAAWRRFEKSKNPDELLSLGFDQHKIETLQLKIASAYSWEKQPFPKWQISNLGAVIRDVEKRIERLQKVATMPTQTIEAGGIRLEDCPQDNRVRLFFPGKPDEGTRRTLKQRGFRWTPSLGCWQAYRNWHAMELAKTFVQEVRP